jgi:hypothetical protein
MGAAFEVPELVEDEHRMIAHAVKMPVPSCALLSTHLSGQRLGLL